MNLTFKQICEIDFNSLPDEALKAVYSECHKVISRRRLIVKANTNSMLHLKCMDHPLESKHRLSEFQKLIDQDWSCTYPEKGGEKHFYVYAHVEKSKKPFSLADLKFTGAPFYIGKGCGSRAYDLKRNEGHGATLKKLLNAGHASSDIVQILQSGMTESEALCYEAKLIYFLGTKFQARKNGVLVNLALPQIPAYLPYQ